MSETARKAYEKIRALKQLSERVHIFTHKSQRALLLALSPEDLPAVALALRADLEAEQAEHFADVSRGVK
jgi:hypothetical protein